MFLTDFHLHSSCSPDGHYSMLDMAQAESDQGIQTICFTDHCDLEDGYTGLYHSEHFAYFTEAKNQYAAAKQQYPHMDIRLGMELGAANHFPQEAIALSGNTDLDFIIASIHNLRGKPDFYYMEYPSEAYCESILMEYLNEYIELAALDCFDVLGHIGYTRRYMQRAGKHAKLTMQQHGDLLDTLFQTVIANGKGIELNCSGFRQGGIGDGIPDLPLLKRYRQLHGEIITIGSDAHTTKDAGTGVAQGMSLLQEAGFSYVTIFKNRIPEFVKIS